MSLLTIPPTIEAASWDGRRAAGPPVDPADPAFGACREITRIEARNFYLGIRLAPEPKRSAMLAIYTWMRYADDLADVPGEHRTGESRRAEIARLRCWTLAACETGTSPATAGPSDAPPSVRRWWPALASTIRAYALPGSIFADTLGALDADTLGVDLAAEDDLARYTDRVAGTVAMACVRIWGVRRADLGERAAQLAVRRARAVQLTNILRDLREDLTLDPRRSYLTRESYERRGLGPDGLLAWSPADRCAGLIGEWIERARSLYEASRDLESVIDPSCARVSWALSEVYRALLDSIARSPDRVARQRVAVARSRKASIALAGWLGVGLPG